VCYPFLLLNGAGFTTQSSGPTVSDIESDLDKLFNSDLDFNLLPEREPHRCIITPLKSYQKQGLEWMWRAEERRTMETGDSGFFFWVSLSHTISSAFETAIDGNDV
jgi:SNF2 family DNA or RNA helicase